MVFRRTLIFVFTATALLLQACGAADPAAAIQTGIAQTLQIAQLQTAAAGGGATATAGSPSDTPLPSETPGPVFTSTSSIPYISVSTNTNCRTGPGVIYDWITTVNVGEQVEVLQTFSSDYAVVRNPHGSVNCWLWLQYASQTNFSGYNLPQATQPPTPTNTATPTSPYIWDGNWTTWPEGGGTCTMTLTKTGLSIEGTYNCPDGGYGGTVSGTLSADLRTVTGTWDTGGTGSFEWQRKVANPNQFVGNWNDTQYWCGARAGASQPDPCEWSP